VNTAIITNPKAELVSPFIYHKMKLKNKAVPTTTPIITLDRLKVDDNCFLLVNKPSKATIMKNRVAGAIENKYAIGTRTAATIRPLSKSFVVLAQSILIYVCFSVVCKFLLPANKHNYRIR
jgi:hypothetical protein